MARLTLANWDQECRIDFMMGKGFHVYENTFKDKHKEEKSLHGIQSPLFGSDWEDEHAFMDRYSCKCKAITGKAFEGTTCSNCKTTIKFRDVDMEMTGWIILNNHRIIQPMFYSILKDITSEPKNDTLNYMLMPAMKINKDGIFVENTEGVDMDKNPYLGIGVEGIYERWDEILDYYYARKKNRREAIDMIRPLKNRVFTSCIPVYSSVLRPIGFGGKDAYFVTQIDKMYPVVITKTRTLNRKRSESTTDHIERRKNVHEQIRIHDLQQKVNEIWDYVFKEIDGKSGQIRGEILGGRMNYSARSVIVPNPDLEADEVVLGYLVFLELYRYEIIRELVRITKCTYQEAMSETQTAEVSYNPRIYEIMCYIINDEKPHVLINRNPTIKLGSAIFMRIKRVRPGLDANLTTEVPIAPLKGMNADFDGDETNIFADKFFGEEFDKVFNPRKSLYVSRNNGMFNPDTNLLKDQMIGLYQFNNI